MVQILMAWSNKPVCGIMLNSRIPVCELLGGASVKGLCRQCLGNENRPGASVSAEIGVWGLSSQ